ncbi:protein TPR3-like [Cornus florida]|uniref:protein TPR3-like n=1 Tax=Cornus florida TaxID=4283 RepID=UPI00289671AD|nr:protein TPR3-like [Cornus florida]
MSFLNREFVFLLRQFLGEEKFNETAHKLEQELGLFFNLSYIEELVKSGDWDEVEKYFSGFTKVDDNEYSTKVFFKIRKQKYLEAVDRKDTAKAVDILRDLKVVSAFDESHFKELPQLLVLENFRENEQLSKSARRNLFHELELLIRSNPLLRDKLNCPDLKSRLQTLMTQRSLSLSFLNCQNLFHENPTLITDTETPLVDPSRSQLLTIGPQALPSVANPLTGAFPKAGDFSPFGAHGPVLAHLPTSSKKPLDFTAFASPAEPVGFAAVKIGCLLRFYTCIRLTVAAILEHPGVPPTKNSAVVYQTADSEHNSKSSIWELKEINEPSQCRSLRLPDSLTAIGVSRLMYTESGAAILALAENAEHTIWKWPRNDKATACVVPQLWQPSCGILMTNDVSDTHPVYNPCIHTLALTPNGSCVMSSSGGKISIYKLMTFETIRTLDPPPPSAATFLAFYPQDDRIIAVGMKDSYIQIYSHVYYELITTFNGHQGSITGLAFSTVLNVLVSSGDNAQLCVWNSEEDEYNFLESTALHIPYVPGKVLVTDTFIQFHQDQIHLLVACATEISIYKAPELELLKLWIPPKGRASLITHATYSCDSQSVYVGFDDGSVGILTASATLQLRCMIKYTSYLPATAIPGVHPVVIAAHPTEPNQFALGLSNDYGVCILEPLESEGKWGTSPPHVDCAGPSTSESLGLN